MKRRGGRVRVELWVTEETLAGIDSFVGAFKGRADLMREALDSWLTAAEVRRADEHWNKVGKYQRVEIPAPPVVVVAPPASPEPNICHRCRDGKHGDCQKGKMSNPEIAARERCECADPGHEEFAARFRADIARIKGAS